MNVSSVFAGALKLGREGSWSQPASPPGFPTRHVDVWRVRLDESATPASRAAFCRQMRLRAPADFTSRKIEFTSADAARHFDSCLRTTSLSPPPRFALSIWPLESLS